MLHSMAPRTGRPRKGVGLASTLVVISIIVVLGFTVAGISFSHLSVSTRLSNAEIARNRAESVVAMAIDRVITDRETSAPDFSGTLNLPIATGDPAGSGTVTFDATNAGSLGIPYSTNNISADVSKIGDLSRTVPSHGIHIVGVGVCNGVERRVEAMLLIPKFPHSIASSGRITSNGGLTVAAVDDLSLLTSGGLSTIPPDQIEPGDIACNSTNITNAMYLYGPDIHITGDAKAVGGIQYDSSQVVVDGAIKPNSDKSYLPTIDITDYDPATKPGLVTVSGNQSNLTVNNWTKSSGDLIISGGLTLDYGVLYVDGNLSVNGGIKGNGAVIVTGKTEVFGGGAQATDNMAAILSGGDLKLQATQADGAQFKGLIYTGGNLSADWVTLGGAAVANSPSGSEVSLNNVEMAYSASATEFDIPVGQNAGGGGGGGFPAAPAPNWTPGAPLSYNFQPVNWSVPPCPAIVPVTIRPVMATPPAPSFFYSAGPPAGYSVPSGATLASAMQWEVTVGGRAPVTVSYGLGGATLRATLKSEMQNELGASHMGGDDNQIDQAFFDGYPSPVPPGPKLVTNYVTNTLQGQYAPSIPLTGMNAVPGPPPTTWGSTAPPVVVDNLTISINDSTFADLREKMRVLYWGDSW